MLRLGEGKSVETFDWIDAGDSCNVVCKPWIVVI